MLKSEAEELLKRIAEETGAKFTEEQISCLGQAIMKIAGRMVEESLASWRPGVPGSRPGFFAD